MKISWSIEKAGDLKSTIKNNLWVCEFGNM
jgi:hypothetical protein